ncbi:glycerol kinase GlpK [Synechococcus sp. PCC 7336]|uniref:glycerol kinase GlpK n=1 Tax=Synechococcus sp. PCC 7336 TaxID=195250 RepID=UPI000348D752|nr:glycerol kinase GlpK [Synechococcus sp. PCC 7336]
MSYILALDLGTTGNRAILFDASGQAIAQAYKEFTQYYPQPGWLEHDASEIWRDTQAVIREVFAGSGIAPTAVKSVGLTVQRETCLLWDKATGVPLHRAIVWQDRRTAANCDRLRDEGHAQTIAERTGLVLDAYFSATKLSWLLNEVKQAQPDLDLNNVLAGTIDTWILWNLTGRQVHATDHSNASRTMLFNLDSGDWDDTLLDLFGIPRQLLPEIKPSLGEFGRFEPSICDAELPITAILGDQQAALFAHGCDRPGLMKCTYGTGCFLVSHTGAEMARSQNQLLTTVAWTEQTNGSGFKAGYALEGSMFTGGACIQWLRDGLKIIQSSAETEEIARSVPDSDGVFFVPALSGLGAPHWDMSARGAFLGITGGVQREHMVRAVLEAIAYQVCEIVECVNLDLGTPIRRLKVDGGACQNNFLMQFQADVAGIEVERPAIADATAQGAAFAAGLAVGFYPSYAEMVAQRQIDRVFVPGEGAQQAQQNFGLWKEAVKRAKHWAV